jgi:poly-beta-1,6-N-acetyl-D-glucosamine synthase
MALLIYSFVGYPILVYLISLGKTPHLGDQEFVAQISILVAAHNEERVIAQKIENLLALDYPQNSLEILVGSDNSSDGTVALSEKYSAKGNVRVYDYKNRRGKVGTMNALAREATGEILVLTDANCMFPRNAIHLLVSHFSDPQIGCVAGEKTIIKAADKDTNRGEGMYWKIEAFLRQKESDLGSCAGADGSIYAVRKELYPFPAENLLLMDDFIISLSVVEKGYRCIYERAAQAYEESSDSFSSEFKRKGRILAGAINALSLTSGLLNPFRSPISLQLWSHKILRWSGGVFLLIILISNIVLIGRPLYRLFLLPHLGFYLVGTIGLLLNAAGKNTMIFYIPFYFLFMNYSQLSGIGVLVREGKKGHWERVGR